VQTGPLKITASVAAGVVLAGANVLAYAACYEVRSYRLRRVVVPVLPAGSPSLRVLHISDLHMTPGQRKKVEWVRGLAALEPDLVLDTGDNLSHLLAVPALLEAVEPLLRFPGAFVMGSNDYTAPIPRNPLRYLTQRGKPPAISPPRPSLALPTETMRSRFLDAGWVDLDNARGFVVADGRTVAMVGVDDPHIQRDRYAKVAGAPPDGADAAIAVTHAPYRRVLDAMTADGWPLIVAGHTHGGQVCIPGYGALVTNCDIDAARVKGLSRYDDAYLHVSAGLGTSRFAPVRFACPPEATLMTLVARS
jgi:predicted MPP superfamily phosphohydrolase